MPFLFGFILKIIQGKHFCSFKLSFDKRIQKKNKRQLFHVVSPDVKGAIVCCFFFVLFLLPEARPSTKFLTRSRFDITPVFNISIELVLVKCS